MREHLARAAALRRSGRAGQRFAALDEITQALKLEPSSELRDELRSEAIAALALPDLYPVGPWHAVPAGTHDVDFDEALHVYACTDRRGNCTVRRVADDSEVHRLPGRGVQATPSLRRDGRFLG